jgi:nucleotide-binding universal stress UspA family protein
VKPARSSGFDAEPSVGQGDPVWQRIVASADEHDAAIVVM